MENQMGSFKYEEEFIVNSRGVKLFTCRWLPANEEPKALIFLCHGYAMECSISMRGCATRLVKAGYEVHGIDCEGHGKSSGLLGLISNFDDLVDDLSEHFTNVSERKENRKKMRILMGESMGGAMVLLLHRKKPEYWDGGVLIAPMCKFHPQNYQNFQGFGNSMNHPNYAPRGPYQQFPVEYWQNTSHPYFTPPLVHGYGTPHTTGMPFTSANSNEPATPTSVPETQLSDRESPIEVVNLEKKVSNTEGTRKRSSWTRVEDEILARSFITVSDDPIIGNDQKADAFWGRVASYYNENRPPGSNTRDKNVIRSHWHNTIQKKVYRFNANYNSVYSSYRSGHSDEDILRFAYEKYRDESNGVAFNLEHVWRIVKDRPLFTPQSADHVATKKTRTSESGASNTSSNQEVSIDLDDEDTRPMGQKIAKRKGKDKFKSTMEDLTVNYNNIFAKFTEYTTVKKSEVDLKQKQLEVEEIKAKAALSKSEAKIRRLKLKEYEILNKDTSQMTTEQLIIHECLCQDIRSRWNI